jgi:hypothetical protein
MPDVPEPESPPISTPQPEPGKTPVLGLAIGFAIILAVVAWLIISSRSSPTRYARVPAVMQTTPSDPYAANLAISDVKMLTAENMIGGNHTYIEGKIANHGNKTVNGATVDITFKNSLSQIVQREMQPLMIIQAREPADDIAALSMSPLKPGDTKEFRLSFEHISADWNQQYPEIRVVSVSTK